MIKFYRDLSDNTVFFVRAGVTAKHSHGWGQMNTKSEKMNKILVADEYLESNCREMTREEVQAECPELLNYLEK